MSAMCEPARDYDVTLTAEFVGQNNSEEDWAHFLWRVTLTREGQTRTLDYRLGLGHVQTRCGRRIVSSWHRTLPCDHVRCASAGPQPAPPDLYSVLTSLKADATHGETFEDWCRDYGEDTDSRKALTLYLACQESEAESRRFFGPDWETLLADEDYS